MNTDLEKLNYLRNEIEHRGIFRVKPGSPTLPGKAPNSAYTWQFYLRRCMFDPKFVTIAAEMLVNQLPNQDVQIGACEAAGVPLGLAMSMILGTPMLSIKKSPNEYIQSTLCSFVHYNVFSEHLQPQRIKFPLTITI